MIKCQCKECCNGSCRYHGTDFQGFDGKRHTCTSAQGPGYEPKEQKSLDQLTDEEIKQLNESIKNWWGF